MAGLTEGRLLTEIMTEIQGKCLGVLPFGFLVQSLSDPFYRTVYDQNGNFNGALLVDRFGDEQIEQIKCFNGKLYVLVMKKNIQVFKANCK